MIYIGICILFLSLSCCEASEPEYKASDVPGYVSDQPPQIRFNNSHTFDAEARSGFSQNEASSILFDSARQRPYFALDPLKDPIALNSKEAMSDPKKFADQQSYQNRTESDYVIKTCTERKPETQDTSQCTALRQAHCEQIDSKCIQKEGEKCVVWEQTFRCPNKTQTPQQTLHAGGPGPSIPEGDERLQFEPNTEMNEAISKLYILKQVQDDLTLHRAENDQNKNIQQVFRGTHDKCKIAFGRFSDCCKTGKGWGHSLHLARCNGEEVSLAQKREKGLCIEIGKFCSKRKARVCLQKKRSFCCFPSKFAFVLHKQGRNQLGIGWGTPKYANCRGFTIDELSRLNFEALDLSEFYAEILSKMKNHPVGIIQRNLQNRVEQMSSSFKNEKRSEGY